MGKLEVEKRLEAYIGVEPNRYPIFFDNIFRAMGFGIYRGEIPTISGVQPGQPFHVAFDATRMILIRDYPTELFAEMADIQPLSSKPILGVSHNNWAPVQEKAFDKWELDRISISTALGIGRLQVTSADVLKAGIKFDPEDDGERLRQIANKIGLTNFLSLPVDSLPIYGSFRMGERRQVFEKKNVKRMLFGAIGRGHRLEVGAITHMNPLKALENPDSLIRRLDRTDLIRGEERISITPSGERYVNEKLVGTPQEAALVKTSDLSNFENQRSDFRRLEQNMESLILSSKQEILGAINEVRLQVKETREKHNVTAKYVIETLPGSPIKLQVEIPIGEMAEEDILLKVAEIKAKLQNLPSYVLTELKNSLKNLTKVPQRVKESILEAL